jgi:DNA-binding PadR family transcriptional regulator
VDPYCPISHYRQTVYSLTTLSRMPRPAPSDYLPLKTDAAFVMMALDARPLHGYAIIGDVAERSSGEVQLQTGALYRTLRRLLADELIVECDRPAGEHSADERRRYYRTTPLGRAVLEADLARMTKLVRAAHASRGRKPRLA